MIEKPIKITFIVGCTGSGKGGLGRAIARRTGAEIVSIDSMKIYRRMDIGTAKPSREARRAVPHHLIDVAEPSEEYSVARYVEAADRAIRDVRIRRKPVLVVGGTPMYIKGLVEGLFEGPGADEAIRAALHEAAKKLGVGALHDRLREVDPVAAERIHPNDLRRIVRALEVFELTGTSISALQTQWEQSPPRYHATFIGLRREREDQNRRTNERVRQMIDTGLVDEVTALLNEEKPLSDSARKALGYAEIIEHLAGRVTLADAVEMIKINTRRLAKAQRTWFKRFRDIEWIDLRPDDKAEDVADHVVDRRGLRWKA